ncbi:sensor histidine kinase [Streptomyces plumbidurans]|uniref:sensor histidine kinase n=1 Tax=Streptomyces plumbidurans TaxID=2814589 RepID=UPI0027E0812C|nr:histidine kinase [Streptomyces plumbidurans]
MATTTERTGLLRRRPKAPEITTPPAGTVLPPHVRTGAPDIPVTSVTPALPPGWEPVGARLPGVPTQPDPRGKAGAPPVSPAPSESGAGGARAGAGTGVGAGAGTDTGADPNPKPVAGQVPTHAPAPNPVPEPAPAPTPTPAPTPASGGEPGAAAIPIQVNALQAMCRQVFGFRLAMIALAAPAALVNASPGFATRLVGAAVVVTFMGSYVLFRDWERFGPLLLRHPTLLVVDTLFGSLLLISAGPDTTLAYVSVCTPLLAGIVYGWRGAAAFASLQALILFMVYAASKDLHGAPAETLLLPGLCVIAGAVGSALRNLMLRFGAATQALTTVQARLAVTEAVSAERSRLAREMHDSVAKTLHGVALAADGLAGSAGAPHMDAKLVRQQAELVARSARRAAAESRELLADLRRESDPDHATDVLVELAARTRDFSTRTGLTACYRPTGEHAVPPVPPAVARQLLTIASEAMENAHRHAGPTRVDVSAGVHGDLLRISVYDDGRGLPSGTTLEQLRRAGHFGLVGMVERAASVGARIRIGRGGHPKGTEVRLELPLAALTTASAPA